MGPPTSRCTRRPSAAASRGFASIVHGPTSLRPMARDRVGAACRWVVNPLTPPAAPVTVNGFRGEVGFAGRRKAIACPPPDSASALRSVRVLHPRPLPPLHRLLEPNASAEGLPDFDWSSR